MGLMDFVRGQLIEIIEGTDDDRDLIAWRFPDGDREIKNGAQLVVRESQRAQFVYLGQFGDTYGPGTHSLTTANIPVLTRLLGWKYGFESPFKADVYFVRTRLFTGNPWGTSNPIMLRDADFGIIRLRAFGTYDFKVVDVRQFLRNVAGTDSEFREAEFANVMRSRIVSVFSDALATANIPALDVARRYQELGEALLPVINPVLRKSYGIEIPNLVVESVTVPPEVEKAIDTRAEMAAIGNMNDYVKYQVAQGFSHGGAGGGTAGFGADLAVGLVMAQQVLKQATGVMGEATATSPGLPDVLSPSQVAQALGVTEANVAASLESGDLKGKKIGTEWRVTRAALGEFLK
ncbi:MAG: SPFH and helix-turn-helix domain-containing protein [Vicinamibacterales bacterium]